MGCSATRQTYHNITARNNAYFNGNEKLKTIQKSVAASYQDNYDSLLLLRTDRVPELVKTYGTDLDEVIKKASYAIKRHEPSRWTDNSYLLVGKSYFLKENYEAAIESFKYINTEFKDEEVKESKKQDNKKKKKKKKKKSSKKKKKKKSSSKKVPIKSDVQATQTTTPPKKAGGKKNASFTDLLKPVPVRPQALVWMVDTYAEQKKYREADAVITIIEAEEDFPKKLRRELAVTKANLAIIRGTPERAVQPLTQAVSVTRKKKYKSRYYYVLGQIYEMNKSYSRAIDNYKQVLKNRPKFDMEFNAKLSIARVAGFDKSMSAGEITKLLNKLLKDRKNKDFYDQIYYSLAELAWSRGDKPKTIENLEKSIRTSTTNNMQKGLSFYKLAEIYYNDEDYVKAQAYYDSAQATLPSSYVHYEVIKTRADILTGLIRQMEIVTEQDSLLYIASLPEKERDKIIDKIMWQKEKERKPDDANNDPNAPLIQNKPLDNNATASTSGWYFYNSTAKSNGYNNFIKKWGQRPLEDHWRRLDKSSSSAADIASDTTSADSGTVSLSDSNLDRDALLKALPISSEQAEQSNKLISDALYKMGNIYRVDLKNNNKAIETFEKLVTRFPKNEHAPEAHYNLYILYKELGNGSKAENYKNILLNEFPKSIFAKYIINPELLEEEKMRDKILQDYYESVYNMYLNNQLEEAFASIRKADSVFPNNSLKPKFALLEAQTIAKTKDIARYLDALQTIVDDYPSTGEGEKAQEIINFLRVSQDSTYQVQINISDFKYDVDAMHFFAVAFNNDSIHSSDLTNGIAAYNDHNRSLEELNISTVSLDGKTALLLVKSFKNMKAAVNYYNAISASAETFQAYPQNSLRLCVMSDVNFNKVIMHREADSYFKFFEARYITNP